MLFALLGVSPDWSQEVEFAGRLSTNGVGSPTRKIRYPVSPVKVSGQTQEMVFMVIVEAVITPKGSKNAGFLA